MDSTNGRWFCHSSCGRGGDIFARETELHGGGDFPAIKAEVYRIIGRTASPNWKHSAHKRTLTTYEYADETGGLLSQVVRMIPKAFKQRKPDGKGAWIRNINAVRLVLYRLPELLKRATETVSSAKAKKTFTRLNNTEWRSRPGKPKMPP